MEDLRKKFNKKQEDSDDELNMKGKLSQKAIENELMRKLKKE